MIEPYSRPELAALWSDASRFELRLRGDHQLRHADRFLGRALAEEAYE
jgi:hypothetical protein